MVFFSCLVCCFSLLSFACFATTAQPTIINSTGEYYITNKTLSFKNESIECNASIDSCYIICKDAEFCQLTNIICSSDYCHIECSNYESCEKMNINTTLANKVDLLCSGYSGCERVKFIGPNHNKTANTSVYIQCFDPNDMYGNPYSCNFINITSPSYYNDMKSATVDIDCFGGYSCTSAFINTMGNTQLTLNCVNKGLLNQYGDSTCWMNALYISSLTNHTYINCNQYRVCAFSIYLKPEYENNFIRSTVNGTDSNYSTIYFINCIPSIHYSEQYNYIVDCTNYTEYPIVDTIHSPTLINGSDIYYISNQIYEFLYKQIILNESNSNYYVYCKYRSSCSDMIIQFGSNCNGTSLFIVADAQWAIEWTAIVSESDNNNSLTMYCNYYGCQGANVYGTYDSITMFCNGYDGCKNVHLYDLYVNQVYINCTMQYDSCDDIELKNIHRINNLSVNNYYYIAIQSISTHPPPIEFVLFQNENKLYAQNASLLNVTFVKSDYLYPIDIYGPINNTFNLICYDEGCWTTQLYLIDGLNDVNVTFGGNCTCNSTSHCIDQWQVHCGYEYDDLFYFDGESCRDIHDNHHTQCCIDKNVQQIQKSFKSYWYNPMDACVIIPDERNHDTNYLIIGSIAGGSLLVVIIFLTMAVIFYRKRKAKIQKDSQYQQINK